MKFHSTKSAILCGLISSLLLNIVLGTAIYYGITTRATFKALYRDVEKELRSNPAAPDGSLLICWGDSLTSGEGASLKHDYPSLLQTVFDREAYNGGVGGQTSTQIETRMLARRLGLNGGVTIIWAGRNNYLDPKRVESDIAAMIASLPSGAHYLVLDIPNGDYPGEHKGQQNYRILVGLNADLARIYADRYVPIREYLVSLFDRSNARDVQDHDWDIVPSSLRADNIHLNDAGYALVASYLEKQLRIKGW